MTKNSEILGIPKKLNRPSSKVSRTFGFLLSILVLSTSFASILHFHVSESELEISHHEHETECLLCEVGFSSNTDLALPSLGYQALFAISLSLIESNILVAISSTRLPYSARAPPAS